jgi:peptidoglycan/LPS O-acetylase OafA/YrhL
MQYRPEIDGLRALAVLPVILFHAGFQTFSGGFIGVDVFFVISGYLITSIILTEKQAGTFSLKSFYERRARRILPALFVVMFACLPFAWLVLLPGQAEDFFRSLVAVSIFSSNILFWRESGYFETAAEGKPLLHTWSLGVEEQYYLFFPIFLLSAWRLGKPWIVAILVFMAVVSFGIAHWGSFYHPEAAFFLLPSRGWELLIGVFIAFYLFRGKDNGVKGEKPAKLVSESVSLLGLLLIVYAIIAFDKNTPFPGASALIPTIGAALIILFATPETFIGKLLGVKLLVGIGLISYSAYLWHQPLFAFARHISKPSPSLLLSLVALAFTCAYISWKYVEQPFRNKYLIKRPFLFSLLGASTVISIGIGLMGYSTGGFLDRYSPDDRELAGLNFREAGLYVHSRFMNRLSGEFDDSRRRKVLIIGDSYAEDLVNAVYEGGLSAHLQIVTHVMDSVCGNLFVEMDLTANIREVDRPRCLEAGWYKNQNLQRLMREADAIWVASSWRWWVAELLPESIQNIKKNSKGNVAVFGGKNFGKFTMKELLNTPPLRRQEIRNIMPDEHLKINRFMRNSLPKDIFVDVSSMFCEEEPFCPLFTEQGELLTYDSVHLTKHGARYLGRKLFEHPIIHQFLLSRKQAIARAVSQALPLKETNVEEPLSVNGSQNAIIPLR